MRQRMEVKKPSAEKVIKDIRRVTRKQYGAEEKIRIVLDGLRGEESIAALCRREGIAESLYYNWSKEFRLPPPQSRLQAWPGARPADPDRRRHRDRSSGGLRAQQCRAAARPSVLRHASSGQRLLLRRGSARLTERGPSDPSRHGCLARDKTPLRAGCAARGRGAGR